MLAAKIGYFRSTTHPEAANWAARVATNGGSVSASTLAAVDAFCRAIDTAGIRDRFFRLNLFCGNGLSSALVPLYRGASLTGTQFGNATDFNNGPFVSGDYSETGSSGGLKSDGTSKHLRTGFRAPSASLSASNFHIGVYASGVESNGTSRFYIGNGTNTIGINLTTSIGLVTGGSVSAVAINESAFLNGGSTDRQGLLLAVNNGNRNTIYYDDGTSVATWSGSQTQDFETGTGDEFYVFARNFQGATQLPSLNKRLRAYSLGRAFTASQVSAFQTAMVSFQTALSRNV